MLLRRTDEICTVLKDKFLGRTDHVRDVVGEVKLRNEIIGLELHEYVCDFSLFM